MAQSQPDWRVLLIGGSSGVGKTLVARELAGHFGVSLILADDVRLALQEVTTPAQNPDLHTFITEGSTAFDSPAAVQDGLAAVAAAMVPALKVIMAHHVVVEGAGSIIIEGDSILPELAVARDFGELTHFQGFKPTREVRGVFLFEPDESIVLRNMRARGRGFQDAPPTVQAALVSGSWQYGQWLRSEAERQGVPVILSRPYETLAERIRAVCGA